MEKLFEHTKEKTQSVFEIEEKKIKLSQAHFANQDRFTDAIIEQLM